MSGTTRPDPRRYRALPLLGIAVFLAGALVATLILRPPRGGGSGAGDPVVPVTILQLNDVYEMWPLDGKGGLARVATLRRQLEAENPNTIVVLSGDLVSPSALSQARVDGKRLAGRQMIDLMNRIGLTYATFGNHEFDLDKDDFDARLRESTFKWISSNVTDARGQLFPGTNRDIVITVTGRGGTQARIGLFGLTIASTKKDYVAYSEAAGAARTEVESLAARADIIVALTHLPLAEDEAIVEATPRVDLVLGGHEHENVYVRRGPTLTPIAKADSNARTVYVHRLRFDTVSRHLDIDSKLTPITDTTREDSAIAAAVIGWRDKAFEGFRQEGFEPLRVAATTTMDLDGREASVRTRCTSLTRLIGAGMVRAVPGASAAIFNSGSIRLDDELKAGPITEYDVLRILPFPGNLSLARMRGSILAKALRVGRSLQGSGGFLQTFGIDPDGRDGWTIAGKPLVENADYPIVINDYLLGGRETGLEFLGIRDGALVVLRPDVADVRKATIEELKALQERDTGRLRRTPTSRVSRRSAVSGTQPQALIPNPPER